MRLTEDYGVAPIGKILKELDGKNQYSYAEVLSLLRYQQDCTGGTRRLSKDALSKYHLQDYTTSYMSLKLYDNLTLQGGMLYE